ncbi:hypothetical protein [Arthrobacter sp. 179]|uniref:hypothetical protein n=1 Tax=Arthrobacter sp. 179 TaxID=3457734 RepID=UPI004034E1B2
MKARRSRRRPRYSDQPEAIMTTTDHAPAMQQEQEANMSTETVNLPAGHDDKASTYYVPQQLRELYVDAEPTEQDESDATADVGLELHAERVGRRSPFRMSESYIERDPEAAARLVDDHTDPIKTARDFGRVVHNARLRAAGRALEDQQLRKFWTTQHTCSVCGDVNGNVHVDTIGGKHGRKMDVLACWNCLFNLELAYPEHLAKPETMDGRDARQVAVDYLKNKA